MISQTQHNHPTRTLSPDQSTETALVLLANRMNLGDEHTRAGCIKSPGYALCCAVLCVSETRTVVSLPAVGLVCCVLCAAC